MSDVCISVFVLAFLTGLELASHSWNPNPDGEDPLKAVRCDIKFVPIHFLWDTSKFASQGIAGCTISLLSVGFQHNAFCFSNINSATFESKVMTDVRLFSYVASPVNQI